MSPWRTVHLGDVPPTPWKNGGGVTRELLAWPDAVNWQVRLSVAEIGRDGPFSAFPGVQRWFAVLSGAGVRLATGAGVHTLDTHRPPFAFEGDAQVDCTLVDGATQDFNLMARRGRSRLQRVRGRHAQACSAMSLIAVYVQGMPARATFDHETVNLAPGALAWRLVASPGEVVVEAPDALWMEVTP